MPAASRPAEAHSWKVVLMKSLITLTITAFALILGCANQSPEAKPISRSVSSILKDARSATANDQSTYGLIAELKSLGGNTLPLLRQERITAKADYDKALDASMINSQPYFEEERIDANLYLAFVNRAIADLQK